MKPIDILRVARQKIADPIAWGKGRRRYDRPLDTCCIAEAIEESAPPDDDRRRAVAAVYCAAGLDWNDDKITEWNDAPERTHAEILRTLDLAIATLRI